MKIVTYSLSPRRIRLAVVGTFWKRLADRKLFNNTETRCFIVAIKEDRFSCATTGGFVLVPSRSL